MSCEDASVVYVTYLLVCALSGSGSGPGDILGYRDFFGGSGGALGVDAGFIDVSFARESAGDFLGTFNRVLRSCREGLSGGGRSLACDGSLATDSHYCSQDGPNGLLGGRGGSEGVGSDTRSQDGFSSGLLHATAFRDGGSFPGELGVCQAKSIREEVGPVDREVCQSQVGDVGGIEGCNDADVCAADESDVGVKPVVKRVRIKGAVVEVSAEEKRLLNRQARAKAKRRKDRKLGRGPGTTEHPYGFWASCDSDVRERLIASKAEMHIAENEKRAAEARVRRDAAVSPQAVADRVVDLMRKGGKILADSNTPMGRVAGWAKTVYSDSAVSLAKSAPSSVQSFESYDAAQVEAIVDQRVAESEAKLVEVEKKLAQVTQELELSKCQAATRVVTDGVNVSATQNSGKKEKKKKAKFYRIPFVGDGTDPFASVQIVSGVKIRTNFDTSDPERLPVMSEFGGDEDAYIAALLSHRQIHDKWRDLAYPTGDHRRKKPGESNQEHFERLQRMSKAEREALPDWSKLGY